jgi:hypothetical protein
MAMTHTQQLLLRGYGIFRHHLVCSHGSLAWLRFLQVCSFCARIVFRDMGQARNFSFLTCTNIAVRFCCLPLLSALSYRNGVKQIKVNKILCPKASGTDGTTSKASTASVGQRLRETDAA